MGSYNDYALLHAQFTRQLGRAYRGELPESLIRELAVFCDRHPNDGMTAFYASRLLDCFYRKRSTEKSQRLLERFEAALQWKPLLIIVARYWIRDGVMTALESLGSARVWRSVKAFEDGYDKANLFAQFGYLLTESTEMGAFNSAFAMPRPSRRGPLVASFLRCRQRSKPALLNTCLLNFPVGRSRPRGG